MAAMRRWMSRAISVAVAAAAAAAAATAAAAAVRGDEDGHTKRDGDAGAPADVDFVPDTTRHVYQSTRNSEPQILDP
jgi:Ni/Co efflux regulator RcnB